jgi:activator of HSP90 ATPase
MAEGIRNWGTRDAVLDSRNGGTGEFRFYEGKGVTKVRVDDLKSQVRVDWKTISANAPGGWDGTTITFDLRGEGSDTVLSFAHRGFEHADEGYALVTTGWGTISSVCNSICRRERARLTRTLILHALSRDVGT